MNTDDAVAGAVGAHRRLFETLAGVDDDMARRPSLLPDWSVGHVLTHLARNADSHVRMLEAARQGQAVAQYPGGFDQRAADIEAGAGRSAVVLVEDVRSSAARLEQAWAAMTPEAWDGHGLRAGGEVWPCRQLPFHRWREVEVHHADLGLAFSFAEWSEGYASAELEASLPNLPDRLDGAGRRRLAAWLLDRAADPGPLVLGPWQSNPVHYHR